MATTRSSIAADVLKVSVASLVTFLATTYVYSSCSMKHSLQMTAVSSDIVMAIPPANPIPALQSPQSQTQESLQTKNQDYFTQEEILYFTTGAGNQTQHQSKLSSFVRSQLAKPSKKFLQTYNGWPKVDFSLYKTSPMVDKVFRGKKNGFFIECGGADGIYQSTSAFFELARNWTGLLVEGNLHLRPKILTIGRNAYILNACLSTKNIPMWVKFNNAFAVGGLESFVGNVRKAAITPVTCYPFFSIMDALGRTHIDLFILDVQGVELEIFKTIDFKKYRIDVIVAEHELYPADAKASAIRITEYRQFFESTGLYKEIKLSGPSNTFNRYDILFHRKDFQVGSVTD